MADKELTVICAASGKQASHLLPHLTKNPQLALRLVVNIPSSQKRLSSQYFDAEVVTADLTQPDDCKRILRGAHAVYHVGPPMHPHETSIGYNMIDAAAGEAKKGKFEHFVYSSVLCTQLRKLLNHDCKRYVEEYLIESGLNYTILQPTNVLETLPIGQWLKDDKPTWKSIHNPDTAFSHLALRDLGEASAQVIVERKKHYFAQYQCASTMPRRYSDVVNSMGKAIGKDIQIEWLPYDVAIRTRLAGGLGGEDASAGTQDIVKRLVIYSNDHGVIGNPNVLEWLLGRKTTTPEQWATMQMEAVAK